MSQRISGYARLPDEQYATIEHWPVRAAYASADLVGMGHV